jgi:16S rRNA (guanine1516-N2)-methyltransferase
VPGEGSLEMQRIAVTTSLRPSPELQARACAIAAELEAPYAPRRDDSIAELEQRTQAVRLIVVKPDRVALRDTEEDIEYQFHPNMIPVRGLNWMRGARDLFLEAMDLRIGDQVLDCTLGFGTEASLAALAVGTEGRVVGLESVPELASVTREGMRRFPMPQPRIAAAMRRVQVVTADYRTWMASCADESFDAVYFDPFFEERLSGAENSVTPLAHFGNRAALDNRSVQEARRIARRRVVIKHPWGETLPEDIVRAVSHRVTARHSRLIYSVFERETTHAA